MRSNRSLRRRLRTAVTFTAAVSLLGVVAVSQAPPANAGLLPSTTTLSVTPTNLQQGSSVTMTSTVSLLNLPGLGVTPSGTVSFDFFVGAASTHLATGTIAGCLLKTCTVTASSPMSTVGSGKVVATYSGDAVLTGSSASVPVTVTAPPPPPPPTSTSKTCGQEQCQTSTVEATQGQSRDDLQVTADPDPFGQTVTASLAFDAGLDCPAIPGDLSFNAATATFSSTSTTAGKTITITLFGQDGINENANYGQHVDELVCYSSPHPFNGWTPGAEQAYGAAPNYGTVANPQYEAYLGSCANHSGYIPCFTNNDATALNPPYEQITVKAPPGDPKAYPG